MKRTLIILVAAMTVVIGVLAYVAYPQIKVGWEKRFGAKSAQWLIDTRIAETDAEKTYISMYNEFAEYLPELIEERDKGGALSPDDEWKIKTFGVKIAQFYEQNQLSIRPSVAFAALDKVAEIMGEEKPSVAWAQREQRKQDYIREQDSIQSIRLAEIERHENAAQRQTNQHMEQCSVCKEWYDDDDLRARSTHWKHEEEALVREFFGEAGARKYREGRWKWDFDSAFLKSNGMWESEWLSVSEIRGAWIAQQKWKRDNPPQSETSQVRAMERVAGRVTTSYDMSGRSVAGNMPLPRYTGGAEGRVVVEIKIDASGNVTNAAYQAQGSTTSHNELKSASLTAARQTRFNVSADAPNPQKGTITYVFIAQ